MSKPIKIHPVEKIDELKSGQWWLWDCEVEMSDGTTRIGTCEGSEHELAEETLELEPQEKDNPEELRADYMRDRAKDAAAERGERP